MTGKERGAVRRLGFCVALSAVACDPPTSLPAADPSQRVPAPVTHAPLAGGVCEIERPECPEPLAFDDPRLEEAVRDAIHKPHDAIMRSDVAELRKLFVQPARSLGGTGRHRVPAQVGLVGHLFPGLLHAFWPRWGSRSMVTDLTPLAHLAELEALNLYVRAGTDLDPLSRLPKLRELHLQFERESDLTPLARLVNLELLDLSDTPVSDLRPLSRMTGLQVLDLSDTQVRDLSPLLGLPNLEVLALELTDVDCTDQAATIRALNRRVSEFVIACPADFVAQ